MVVELRLPVGNAAPALCYLLVACSLAGCQPKPAPDTNRADAQGVAPPAPSPTTPRSSATTSAAAPARSPPSAPSEAPPEGEPKPAPASEEKHAYRIAAIGDSLTDEKSFGGGYLRYVKSRCPETRIDNFGKGGHMVNQIRRRFENEVHNQPMGTYTHLVVYGGVNDLYSDLTAGRTPDKIEKDLAVIYEKARAKGLEVVAITVSPWGGFERYHNARRQEYTEDLNDWIRAQLQTGAVDFVVDSYPLLSCGESEKICPEYEQSSHDGLHLGKKGHEVLGRALYEQVFSKCS